MKHDGTVPFPLSGEQRGILETFAGLLRSDGVPRGVVARGDASRIWERHILDSLRGAARLPSPPGRICDLGSGGGLPGVVLAVARPDLTFVLAERRRNRSAFLASLVRRLGLTNAEIHAGDVAALERAFDGCTARAFGDATASWQAAEPLLKPAGRLLYWAGASFDPAAVPTGVRAVVFRDGALAGSGPLVIMSRQ